MTATSPHGDNGSTPEARGGSLIVCLIYRLRRWQRLRWEEYALSPPRWSGRAKVPAAQTASALVLLHLRIQPLQDRPVAGSAQGPSDDLVRDEVELDVEVLGDRAQQAGKAGATSRLPREQPPRHLRLQRPGELTDPSSDQRGGNRGCCPNPLTKWPPISRPYLADATSPSCRIPLVGAAALPPTDHREPRPGRRGMRPPGKQRGHGRDARDLHPHSSRRGARSPADRHSRPADARPPAHLPHHP